MTQYDTTRHGMTQYHTTLTTLASASDHGGTLETQSLAMPQHVAEVSSPHLYTAVQGTQEYTIITGVI